MSAGTNRIITPLIVVLILAMTAPTFAGQIIYVDDDAPADFNNIQAAINDSNNGDTIIVAEGRYFENINFWGKNITLRSTDPNDPNVVAATIIDGNQNGSVVTFNSGEDANCVLNGFTITNGNAEYGGGIYCGCAPGPPPPPPPPHPPGVPIPECNFPGPTITNCIISNNSADAGGGMYNDWASSPTLTNCTFSGNSAYHEGGGMFNESHLGIQVSPSLTNCTFIGNSADFWGGGMCNIYSSPKLTNCTFNKNSADSGGGMLNIENSPTLTNCTFTENSAVDGGLGWGGGVYNYESSPILTNCTFNENSAKSGGGILNHESSPTLTNCTFKENSADSGGGMCNQSFWRSEINPILTNCTFNKNSASTEGGGLLNYYSSPIVDNCMFTGNSVVGIDQFYGYGGGMYNDRSSPILKKCTFSGNLARYGGGMYSHEGYYTMVINPIFTSTVINCIFWDNGSDGISGSSVDATYTTYSDIEGGWPGQGNIDADPCFVKPGYWEPNCIPNYYCTYDWIDGDYHLLPSSPCINTGDPNYVAAPNDTDLDGKPRVMGGRIDMGAFEYRHLVPAEVRIVPRTINLANRGKWITTYLWLPEEYNVAEIDFCILLLENEIEPEQFWFNEKKQVVIAVFNRQQLQGILDAGVVELTVSTQLTDATCFEGTDVIKVIYKGGGKLAKDGKAGNPNPADGATNVSTNADLSWTAGYGATSHDVYFGTSSTPPFIGNHTDATFDPGTMDYETTYFWCIDEVNKWGIATGDIWTFTTMRRSPPPPPPPPPPW